MARFAEFFSGIGLVREAIEPLGWECVFANDIAPDKAEMYIERFGDQHLIVDDINNLTLDDLPDDLDLLTATFPCIDLSLAGNRRGLDGEHSGTIWPFLELAADYVAKRTAPQALLLENVTGFVTSHGGRDLAEVCGRIGDLGYQIDLTVVDAKWFTPQSRPRLFLLALRDDLATCALPPTGEVTRLRNTAIRRFQSEHRGLPLVELPLPEPPHTSPQAPGRHPRRCPGQSRVLVDRRTGTRPAHARPPCVAGRRTVAGQTRRRGNDVSSRSQWADSGRASKRQHRWMFANGEWRQQRPIPRGLPAWEAANPPPHRS